MQYPNHLILDLQKTTLEKKNLEFWPKTFLEKTKTSKSKPQISSANNTKEVLAKNTVLGNNFKTSLTKTKTTFNQNFLEFNLNFLRKERLYTKLKYSRCPQYDIVSGGWAALFAGLIGFLISEKFGIELVDSGDFYNALMYGIFLVFALRPIIRILGKGFSLSDLFLVQNLFNYFSLLFTITLNYLYKKKKY